MTTNPESVHRHDPEVNRRFIALMEAQEGLPKFAVALAVNDPARPARPAPEAPEEDRSGSVAVAPQIVTFTDLTGDVLKIGAARGSSGDPSTDHLLISSQDRDGEPAAAVAIPFARWAPLLAMISRLMQEHVTREGRRRP